MFSNNLKKWLVVFWQHRNEKKQKHWNDVAKEKDSRCFFEEGGIRAMSTTKKQSVSACRKRKFCLFEVRKQAQTIVFPSQASITRFGRWSGSMNGETLRLSERMTIRGVLLYFEGWVSCRIWCRRWRCQLLDFSSLLRIHLWIGSSTERRMRAESLSVT